MSASDPGKLDRLVTDARRAAEKRERGYREQALKIYPWICGRCAREFTRANVRELTVHHRDHNHDNEHRRHLEAAGGGSSPSAGGRVSTYAPFADLKELLAKKRPPR